MALFEEWGSVDLSHRKFALAVQRLWLLLVLLPEVGHDGQHPPMLVGFGEQAELGEDGGHMRLDGLGMDEELLGDGVVRPSFGHERHDLVLAR